MAVAPLVFQNHTLDEVQTQGDCFCAETLGSEECVVHVGGDGEKHPIHKACAKLWAKRANTCAVCRVEVDGWSLEHPFVFTLVKAVRVSIKIARFVAKAIFNFGVWTGGSAGLIIGTAVGITLGMAAGLLKITLIVTQTELGKRMARVIDPIFIIRKGINSGVQIGASGGAGFMIGAIGGTGFGVVVATALVGILGKGAAVASVAEAIFLSTGLAAVCFGSLGAVVGIIARYEIPRYEFF